MCDISTRLETLNKQLVIISKLQKMGEEYDSYVTCRKCSVYASSLGKYCHCAQRILSLKEQCNRMNYTEEYVSHDNSKRRIPCNLGTCKSRRKLPLVTLNKSSQSSEVQTYLKNTAQVSKSATVNIKADVVTQELQEPERQSKSDQVNLTSQIYKMYTQDKIIDTYEEKSEQAIPTRDTFGAQLSVNSSNTNNMQHELIKERKSQTGTEKIEAREHSQSIEDVCAKDKKFFETIQKDLVNERKRTKELEKKLKSLTCNLNCLKENSEQRAACLKGALETAEEQTKVAMDLMKRSKDQADLVKANKDELLNEIARLQKQITEAAHKNAALLQERDNLSNQLQSLSEDETKRCKEVEEEVNRMKHALKEKENALSKERTEFMDMILELTNVINIQKRRICEITGICNNQQHSIQEKDKELSEKNIELSEMKNMLQSSNTTVKEIEEKVEHLEYCLCEETKVCNCLKQELETLKENHLSELRIKEKIVEEQNKTISKQRKLLHDSEEMVQQVASEFNELKDELQKEKEKNESLQITLDETDNKLSKAYLSRCDKCRALEAEINYFKKEKQRAVSVAKFAYQKLNQSVKEYQKKLSCEKQQHRYMALIIERKEHEIGCLKNQLCQNDTRII